LPRRDTQEPPDGAREVLEYFLEHPAAEDSLHGIARWRLLEDRARREVATTDHALRWLVDKGFLLERSSSSSDPTFRLNARKAAEAENVVRSLSATGRTRKSRF
jgi:hypothetical protein